jgi:hypothetical protein
MPARWRPRPITLRTRDAVSGTPRPETFTHLQARINEGLQRFARSGGLDVVPLQVATTDMAEAQRNALDAQVAHAAAANTTTVEVPARAQTCPADRGRPLHQGWEHSRIQFGER